MSPTTIIHTPLKGKQLEWISNDLASSLGIPEKNVTVKQGTLEGKADSEILIRWKEGTTLTPGKSLADEFRGAGTHPPRSTFFSDAFGCRVFCQKGGDVTSYETSEQPVITDFRDGLYNKVAFQWIDPVTKRGVDVLLPPNASTCAYGTDSKGPANSRQITTLMPSDTLR